MEHLLAISTLLGGAAAVWFFWDKLDSLKLLTVWSLVRGEPATPIEPRSLFAYANGSERLHALTCRIAEKRGFSVSSIDGELAWLNEKLAKLEIRTIRDLDSHVRKYGVFVVRLADYVMPQVAIDNAFVLDMILEIVAMESGGKEGVRELHRALKFSSADNEWVDEMYEAYSQIKKHG